MSTVALVLSIIDVVICLFLIAVVLLQSGKRAGLSGAISGGAETFFGKNKARSMDAQLSRATMIASIFFVVLTLTLNIL